MNVDILKSILLAVMTLFAAAAGIVPIKVYQRFNQLANSTRFQKRGQLIISFVTCFAGGVFLGVCLMDVLPDALDSWDSVKKSLDYTGDYPFVPLLSGVGIIMVWLIEELTIKCQQMSHKDVDHDSECSSIEDDANILRGRKATIVSYAPVKVKQHKTPLSRSITFVAALVCHCTLEGLAFGIQKSDVSVMSLFAGIVIHKTVVFFSVGVRLVRAHPTRQFLIISLIVFIALTAPVGGAIGMIIENSDINHTVKDEVMLVLSCLSLGTFLYITFFELLGPEKENKEVNFIQWIGAVVGFVLISVVMIFSN